jgi:hypothetical protein
MPLVDFDLTGTSKPTTVATAAPTQSMGMLHVQGGYPKQSAGLLMHWWAKLDGAGEKEDQRVDQLRVAAWFAATQRTGLSQGPAARMDPQAAMPPGTRRLVYHQRASFRPQVWHQNPFARHQQQHGAYTTRGHCWTFRKLTPTLCFQGCLLASEPTNTDRCPEVRRSRKVRLP